MFLAQHSTRIWITTADFCSNFVRMGKEQELIEAARTGNVALVEKLLSGKKGLLGSGSGAIPLPNLLRYVNNSLLISCCA